MTISSASFNDRLARIEKTRKSAKGRIQLHIGDQEAWVTNDSAMLRRVIAKPRHSRLAVFKVLPALMVGAIGMMIVTALKMRFLTPELAEKVGSNPDLVLVVAAVLTAFGLGMVLRLASVKLMAVQLLGVALAFVGLHNIAFWEPDMAALAFTPDWVEQQTAQFEPRTLRYAETTIRF
ncbi:MULTISPECIES: hypothetical protein [Thioclava]|uniref:Uncharacterized protein n=1 Tax=Thioclava nitratireducens TaxID=1915078 RepID=A0ABN4XAR5_9RHOB|nr:MULTISPECIES: hypothetical protein [Thioclava]AQS48287.1 hypothetical protein BMG03_11120 [Thioclava nitratireducens]OWY04975.1 hypothetical protein B6V75_02220 [Thioclava sp. F1Mire-8]OWY06589.1 hypothetical protein B6V76_02015 [Thioclava sp. IC9]OWY09146.1 hypothetical protein B6V74_10915 [Thioclava sp. F42-5]WGT50097.1 hypothetical protein P0N61_17605 [Thioclava nitratireducens]